MASEDYEDLLASYLDRLNDGDFLDPAEVRQEHPDCAERLLEDLAAFIDAPPAQEPAPPLGVLGDFTLRRQIGRGGMGIVYDAWENSMERRVALKVLPSSIAADTRTVARFIREAQVAGKLSHPNVVPVFAMGVKAQVPYYAMEFVEGETLARILAEAHPSFGATREELAFYSNVAKAFADVADGLQHAHAKGIVHRDIKPSNLILDREGRLRILDFGLARLEGQESLTQTGDFVGTPLYMSPEQAQVRKIPIDHRTDIYSLGATMYEVLTLRPPFRGKNHHDTLSQIITRDPDPPRKRNHVIPKDLETIVLKCLRKEPRDRYGTAEALGQDLRRFVRGEPIEAKAQGRWERIGRQLACNRRRIVSRFLLVAVLMACGALAYRAYLADGLLPEGEGGDRFEGIEAVDAVNSPWGESSATSSADGRELYFGSRRPEGGQGLTDIWMVRRSSPDAPWQDPVNVEELNTTFQEEPAWLSPDGLRFYYRRVGPDLKGDIFYATRAEAVPGARWEPAPGEDLASITTGDVEGMPSLTPDELEIYFHSDREGGKGKNDIWVAKRPDRRSPFGTPENLAEINDSGADSEPCISADGLTLWWHDHEVGEIWYATRASRDDRFLIRRHLSPPVNSYFWEGQIEVSKDWPAPGSIAYFTRLAGGKGRAAVDIFQAVWRPASEDAEDRPPR
ncbi:MAG: serine/threonine protein kinase [Planctomycetes bacterium]|nr:serine/threonine protein kinase [Planctomycetota bacterium]